MSCTDFVLIICRRLSLMGLQLGWWHKRQHAIIMQPGGGRASASGLSSRDPSSSHRFTCWFHLGGCWHPLTGEWGKCVKFFQCLPEGCQSYLHLGIFLLQPRLVTCLKRCVPLTAARSLSHSLEKNFHKHALLQTKPTFWCMCCECLKKNSQKKFWI